MVILLITQVSLQDVDLSFGVGYKSDIKKTKELLMEQLINIL